MSALPLSAVTLFTEDFESYAAGSNLVGQGGWIGINDPTPGAGPSVVTIGAAGGPFLPTQMMNGRAPTGLNQQNIAEHLVPINSAAITTLQFDAYAPTGAHNQEVSIDTFGATVGDRVLWSMDGTLGWYFGPGGGGGNVFVAGGFDKAVKFRIVLDGIAQETYGQYDFGSGFVSTPHFTLTNARLTSLDAIHLYVDHRDSNLRGIEVDNLVVTAVPVPLPAAMWLMMGPLAGLIVAQRRR